MDDTREAWGQVGDRLSALLLKLKLHAEEEMSEEDIKSMEGVDKLRAMVSETFDAIGDAYKDEAVRDDAKATGRAFIAAMDATSRAVQDHLRSKP
jgi:hypothetical protein